jgi:LmbE family N-acetylglucosaminyl deacetylase
VKPNTVLVIAVHPDDETLGCGGTILRHKKLGDAVHWLIVTEMRLENGYTKDDMATREAEIKAVARRYGMDAVHFLGLPTTRLENEPRRNIVEQIAKVLKIVRPEVLYLPFKSDIHGDHKVTFEAAFSCTKSFRQPYLKRILMMETVSETEFAAPVSGEYFMPNVFINVSKFIESKIEIMRIYNSELREPPFPRSEQNIRALASFRGATAGCRYAEAFMLLRETQI